MTVVKNRSRATEDAESAYTIFVSDGPCPGQGLKGAWIGKAHEFNSRFVGLAIATRIRTGRLRTGLPGIR